MNLEELAAQVAALRTTSAGRPGHRAALAAALHQLAVAHAQAGDLAAAITAGREAVGVRAGLAGIGETTAHELAASLGNLSNMLIDAGQVDEVAPLWEGARQTLSGGESAAPLAVYWARYQLTHGWPVAGLRLATTVAADPQTTPATIAAAHALMSSYAQHRPAVLAESLHGWLTTTTWPDSQAYLAAHPELLATDVPAQLDRLNDPDPPGGPAGPDVTTRPGRVITGRDLALHRALLTLASGPPGTTLAYQCLTDPAALDQVLAAALRTADPSILQAAGTIEVLVHGRALAGSIHALAGQLLTDPPDRPAGQHALPKQLADGLAALVGAATADERRRTAADLEQLAAVAGHPTLAVLRRLVTDQRPEA